MRETFLRPYRTCVPQRGSAKSQEDVVGTRRLWGPGVLQLGLTKSPLCNPFGSDWKLWGHTQRLDCGRTHSRPTTRPSVRVLMACVCVWS